MKVFKGLVVSTKMKDTIVVEVTRRVPHPLYKKLLKRSSRFKAAAPAHTLSVGDTVSIVEIRPVAKTVFFKLMDAKAKISEAKPVVAKENKPRGRAKK